MTEYTVPGIDVDNLPAMVSAALSSEMLDGCTPEEALLKMAKALNCESGGGGHSWWKEAPGCKLPSGRWFCDTCGASPEFVKTVRDVADLSYHCGHVLSGDLLDDLSAHIEYDWLGEETFRSCEMLMPGWYE